MVGRMLLAVALVGSAMVALAGPAVRIQFDGGNEPGVISGRGALVDSVIGGGGGGGKALWCEGVDTAVRVDAGPKLSEGFAVGLWLCPLEMRPGGVIGGGSGKGAWGLEVTKGNALRFAVGGATAVETPADRLGAGQWYHVVVTGERGGACTMYVNGEPGATGTAAVEDSAGPMWVGRATEKGPGFVGLVDDVRVETRAASAVDVAAMTDQGLSWIRRKDGRGFDGAFELREHDVVAMVGGEDLYAGQTAGYLEALLTLKAGGKRVGFRNMAWEGDTVFEQWRILNFGPWARQFERVGASVIIVQFGQVESLRGAEGLKEYQAAYGKLLDEFLKRTSRIVVVSPTPFEDAGPLLPAAKGRNEALAKYVEVSKALAEKRGLLFVDLFGAPGAVGPAPQPGRPNGGGAATRDGMHLTPRGQWLAAREAARQLGAKAAEAVTDDEEPRFVLSGVEELRQAVVAKNELWLRAWRPPNWAFLNGDRITQPSSRDDKDARVRWLPAEWQRYPVMVDREEAKIARVAKGLKE